MAVGVCVCDARGRGAWQARVITLAPIGATWGPDDSLQRAPAR